MADEVIKLNEERVAGLMRFLQGLLEAQKQALPVGSPPRRELNLEQVVSLLVLAELAAKKLGAELEPAIRGAAATILAALETSIAAGTVEWPPAPAPVPRKPLIIVPGKN